MSTGAGVAEAALLAALADRRPGHALPAAFARQPELHVLELDRIWRRGWLLGAQSAELPAPGDQ